MTQRLLLHTCCAPCSTAVIERLKNDGYDITAYFYDPNIHPKEEYEKRLDEMRKWCSGVINIPLLEAPYEMEKWFEMTKGLENEPERGARCTICYDMRMDHAAAFAKENGYDLFTTVLSISPHKDAKRINEIGVKLEKKYGIPYLPADFKKQGGFQRSIELSREFDLFRQDYCGCVFSRIQSSELRAQKNQKSEKSEF